MILFAFISIAEWWQDLVPYAWKYGIPLVTTGLPCALFFIAGRWYERRGLQREKRAAFRAGIVFTRRGATRCAELCLKSDVAVDAAIRAAEKRLEALV